MSKKNENEFTRKELSDAWEIEILREEVYYALARQTFKLPQEYKFIDVNKDKENLILYNVDDGQLYEMKIPAEILLSAQIVWDADLNPYQSPEERSKERDAIHKKANHD